MTGLPMSPSGPDAWLGSGGAMGKCVREIDWSKTPLGAIEGWPQSLRTTVGLCLASNFPISIAWGPEFTQIYNDGYWPICGAKHPVSMGQDYRVCWSSAWPVIGDAFDRAVRGETSFLEDQRMFLDRNGYLEETFFTFSFSPIRDESGDIAGLFHPVTETTSKMLSERRLRTLRDLAARTSRAASIIEVLEHAASTLGADEFDLPFILFYALDDTHATLVRATGIAAGGLAAPASVGLDAATSPWTIAETARDNVRREITPIMTGGAPCGPYPEPPRGAVVLPIAAPGAARPVAIVIAGISSRLPLDDAYRGFYDLLAGSLTTAISGASALEEAKHRAEGLAELDRAKTAFFSNVSHELRTPLTLMIGPTEDALATEGALRGESLHAVYRNELRLLKLVNTLLDFARFEAGRTEATYLPTDLPALTADLASMFRAATERAGVRLGIDCPPLSRCALVDREMWEKIVLNLLSNALKFTFEGSITVTMRERSDCAVLRVTDTGTGIAAVELPRLFDRFHRVTAARGRTHEGSGIGLALVKGLVGLHGGTIDVTSTVGVGTTFEVVLPLATVATATALPAPPRVTSSDPFLQEAMRWSVPGTLEPLDASTSVAADPHTRILVADDNADMREYIARLLAAHWIVETVPDGEAAVAAVQRSKPDLIVSDVMMPGLDGFGVLKALRADPATQKIPIILLSARAGEEAKIEGLEVGADDYLVKPFSAKELIARITTHLSLSRLRNDIQLRDEFLSVAGHELRTPLSTLSILSETLANLSAQATPAQVRERAGKILKQASRLSSLVDQLLNVSRISSGQMNLERETFDLGALVADLAGRMTEDFERGGCDLTVSVNPAVGHFDKARIEQVVLNLLSNALKYGKGSPVEVCVDRIDRVARITVTDHGIGIATEDQQRIFERFERAASSRRYGGLGLGLWITRQLVRAHDGEISVESTPGKGARFVVDLPLG